MEDERPRRRRRNRPTYEPITPSPIFIGGSGRSGTTITGRLLSRHSQYEVIPVEAKFHAGKSGLPGVVKGRVEPQAFVDLLAGEDRRPDRRGVMAFADAETLAAHSETFLVQVQDDPVLAAREFTNGLFSQYVLQRGKPGWIEMTPRTLMHASTLHGIFPEMRMVHALRDGRDVSSSLVSRGWIEDFDTALDWWEARLRSGHRQSRGLPEESFYVLQFDALMVLDREATYAELVSFLGMDDEEEMRDFFDTHMTPEAANIGRWAKSFSAAERDRINGRYAEALDRLDAEGAPRPVGGVELGAGA